MLQPTSVGYGMADYMPFYPFYIIACMLYLFINVSVYKTNVSYGY
jgi:hypothetical protein